MTVQIQYHILFPKTQIQFSRNDLTFSIDHIKSRKPSVLYFHLHCFDIDGDLIKIDNNNKIIDKTSEGYDDGYTVYTSDRWVIGTVYEHRHSPIELSDEIIENTVYTQIEIITMGIDSENPLYFNKAMLQEGEFKEYHMPSEIETELLVGFHNNVYANLYKDDGDYLQVIRPNREAIHTNMIDKGEYTILAPHFDDDVDFDDDVAVFIEAMNQREQTIDVLR